MLKIRIIPSLTIKDRRLVKSVQFKEHRNIGNYIAAARVFNARDVDEMVFLDIDARIDGLKPQLLSEITKECFMPLALGGGVKTCEDIQLLLKTGADKVVINSAVLKRPMFISEGANKFGSQCMVISLDIGKYRGQYRVFAEGGTRLTDWSPINWAIEAEKLGAGEIFLTSIERDGMMNGYDVELVAAVSKSVKIPVIASGGAGNLDDFVSVIKTGGASAVAAASVFQYTETTPLNIKQHLSKFNIETRL